MSSRVKAPVVAAAAFVLPLALALSAAAQVDLSCMGVQAMSAHAKLQSLGNRGGSYQGLVHDIHTMQEKATEQIKPVEDRWNKLRTAEAQRAVDEGRAKTAEQAYKIADERLRRSAEGDNQKAALLEAQYKAHMTEVRMIMATHQVPTSDNEGQVSRIASDYAARAAPQARMVLQNDTTLRHLMSTVAAADVAARNSRDVPDAPLARPSNAIAASGVTRIGFDTAPEKVARSAADLVTYADADRTGAKLIVTHLIDQTGDKAARREVMTNPNSATAKEGHKEIALALTRWQQADGALEGVRRVKLDDIKVPAPETAQGAKTFTEKAAERIGEAVKKSVIYHYVGLSEVAPPPPPPPSDEKKK